MAARNQEFEQQLAQFRANRRLLTALNLPVGARRDAVQSAIRTSLSDPSSVTFFWPPIPSDRPVWIRNDPRHHIGWVMLGFSLRTKARAAENDLRNLKINGRAINIQRAHRVSYRSIIIHAALPPVMDSTDIDDCLEAPDHSKHGKPKHRLNCPCSTTSTSTSTSSPCCSIYTGCHHCPSRCCCCPDHFSSGE